MCWNWVIGFFIGFRVLGWITRFIRYILGLGFLFLTWLYQSGGRRRLDVSLPYHHVSVGNIAGIVLATGLVIASLFILRGGSMLLGLGGAGVLYVGVVTGRLLLLDDLLSPVEDNLANRPETIVFQIKLQQSTSWQKAKALQLIEQLLITCPEFIFQIEADASAVSWQIIDPVLQVDPPVIEQSIRNIYPTAMIEHKPYRPPKLPQRTLRRILYYRFTNMFVAPLLSVNDLGEVDPLTTITNTLSALQPGEQIRFTLAVGGFAEAAYPEGRRQITQLTVHPVNYMSQRGVNDAMAAMASGQDRDDRYINPQQKILEEKLGLPLYYSAFWIQVEAPMEYRLDQLSQLAHNQVAHFANQPFNALELIERPLTWNTSVIKTDTQNEASDTLACYQVWREGQVANRAPTLILTSREIAAMWHLPHSEMLAMKIGWANKVVSVPLQVARVTRGIRLGRGMCGGREVVVRMLEEDRVSHMSVIGITRSGKSNCLHHMIRQDIANGRGVAVLTPHRELIHDILRSSIPANREHEVVLLDIENQDHPPPMNPLLGHHGQRGMLGVISIIERLFQGSDQLVRSSAYIRAALILLQSEPQPTLQDVTRIFLEDDYRMTLLQRCSNIDVREYWDFKYNQIKSGEKALIAEPIINRLRAFYGTPYLYPSLCHPEALPYRQYIQENKIILISLEADEDEVPPMERNMIGALLMAQLQMAGMKDRKEAPYYIYVDEAQHFVTSSMDVMLSEAGKKKLSLITANQFLGQLDTKTLDAILGNVGAVAAFRIGPRDKATLQAYMQPQFSGTDLVDLNRFEAAVKMQVNARSQPAFTLWPDPPVPEPSDADTRMQRIREQSQRQFTPWDRQSIQAWIEGQHDQNRAAQESSTPITDYD